MMRRIRTPEADAALERVAAAGQAARELREASAAADAELRDSIAYAHQYARMEEIAERAGLSVSRAYRHAGKAAS